MNKELISEKLTGKRIYISILNWGLGHATRMVPIIRLAQQRANFVVVGSNGQSLIWLKNYFPELIIEESPPLNITYGKTRLTTFLKLLSNGLTINKYANKEKSFTHQIVCKHRINLIISDNNPWSFNEQCECIYVTHQLNIQAPIGIKQLVNYYHQKLMRKFSSVWVPDFKEDDKCLAGKLSRPISRLPNVTYVGPLSRFIYPENFEATDKTNYNLVIASGPEPQQSVFLNDMLQKALRSGGNWIIIGNKKFDFHHSSKIQFIQNPDDNVFAKLIVGANRIYCRSGYSTIMDLFYLKKPAQFIATPGQWEQEYLEDFYNKPKLFIPKLLLKIKIFPLAKIVFSNPLLLFSLLMTILG